jgi:hypothetical protein
MVKIAHGCDAVRFVGLLTSGAKLFSTFNDNHAVAVHVSDHFSGRAPVLFALMLDSNRRLQPQMVAEYWLSRTGLRPIDHEAKLVVVFIRVRVLEVDGPISGTEVVVFGSRMSMAVLDHGRSGNHLFRR